MIFNKIVFHLKINTYSKSIQIDFIVSIYNNNKENSILFCRLKIFL